MLIIMKGIPTGILGTWNLFSSIRTFHVTDVWIMCMIHVACKDEGWISKFEKPWLLHRYKLYEMSKMPLNRALRIRYVVSITVSETMTVWIETCNWNWSYMTKLVIYKCTWLNSAKNRSHTGLSVSFSL